MTCRELKDIATSLTLWEVIRSEDRQILDHAEACPACGVWLQRQRSLAASMRMLQVGTSGLEAGPNVEQALLRAFRQAPRKEAAVAVAEVKERIGPIPVAALRSTPIALRISRFFEVGAYAAVAAAIIVGLFLGVRLMHDRQVPGVVQSKSGPAGTAPVVEQPNAGAVSASTSATSNNEKLATQRVRNIRRRTTPATRKELSQLAAESSQPSDASQSTTEAAGYVPLMFCDPLSCSSDSQVVRMELPSEAGQDAPPQIADVIVGYDGLVRAVRIVN